jgi:endonuclease/exonuclease/phosphatase family metal-dependent hydrolase
MNYLIFCFYLFVSSLAIADSNVQRFNQSVELPELYNKGNCSVFELKKSYLNNTKIRELIPKSDESHIRISTFNIHHWSGIWGNNFNEMDNHEAIIDDIVSLDSDIIGFQEFVWDDEIVEKLLKKLGLNNENICFCEASNWPGKPFGNCLISRFPIQSFRCVKLPSFEEERAALDAEICINGMPIQIIVTHLDVHDSSGNTRVKQIDLLTELLLQREETCNGRAFILSDMNTIFSEEIPLPLLEAIKTIDSKRNINTPTHEIPLLKNNGLIDSFAYLHLPAPQFSCWSGRRTDFIFFKPHADFMIYSSWIGVTDTSDHLPISIDIITLPKTDDGV